MYQTGPSASPVALLDTFMAFCVAAGWTQDAYSVDGTGKRGHLNKGTQFIHLRSFISEDVERLGSIAGVFGSGIAITASGAYANNANWWNQPGAPYFYNGNPNTQVVTAIMPLPAGAIQNYWMFADAAGDNVHLIALKSSGIYNHLGFGQIIKPQAYTGGNLFTATRVYNGAFLAGSGITLPSGPPGSVAAFLRADVDSLADRWNQITVTAPVNGGLNPGHRMQSSTAPVAGGPTLAAESIFYGFLRARARSLRTSSLLLLPTLWMMERDFGGAVAGGGWSYAGQVPDIFQTTSTGFAPGEQYDISTDEYIIFPEFAVRKYP